MSEFWQFVWCITGILKVNFSKNPKDLKIDTSSK